ncbi:MAG: glycosyltransferase family 2 protein [Candidatus Omnitrophica bacterium]|nr:glycosyltransferase family 2 protein [Candidatus Omnitrophota bacterium]
MRFNYSRIGLNSTEKIIQRFLETLPGALSWIVLGGFCVLAFNKPSLAALLLIAFDFYWLLRIFYATVFLVISYSQLRQERHTDWMARLEVLKNTEVGNIRHLVIFPVFREPEEVVEPALLSLTKQSFPSAKTLVVLAVEERTENQIKEMAGRLREKYQKYFLEFLVTAHPDDLPGEGRVKGANATWAAKKAAVWFQERGIAFKNVIVSCFDADTVVSSHYFACLTYHFSVCPSRYRASFQPIPLYHNNIWQTSALARVLETGSSFFLLIEATDPEKLVTFSSHSMSFKALVEVGYWPVDMISDDSAIFWKSFIHYDGDYRVIPMYVTLSMDVVSGQNTWETLKNIYRQKRRWAWGVENFPLVMRAFLLGNHIPWPSKARHAFKLLEGHVAWATWAFLLTFCGWIPIFFATPEFSNTVFYHTWPRVAGIIFNLSLVSMIVSVFVSLRLLPENPAKPPVWRKALFVVEWAFFPLAVTFLSALPALDAQTRLLLGKRLDFSPTAKTRN